MRTRNPDNRFRAVKAARRAPEHPLEEALWELLEEEGSVTVVGEESEAASPVVAYAYEIYEKITEREILQAWLLTRTDNATIEQYLRIPIAVLAAYRHLFFDTNAFRDELDIISWVNEYEHSKNGTEFGSSLLQQAMMNGVQYLIWLYGRGEGTLDPHVVLQQTMTDTFMRGRAHRGQPDVSSKYVTASHALLKTASTLAQTLSKTGVSNGLNDLLIKLRHRDMTESVESVRKEDLLH